MLKTALGRRCYSDDSYLLFFAYGCCILLGCSFTNGGIAKFYNEMHTYVQLVLASQYKKDRSSTPQSVIPFAEVFLSFFLLDFDRNIEAVLHYPPFTCNLKLFDQGDFTGQENAPLR